MKGLITALLFTWLAALRLQAQPAPLSSSASQSASASPSLPGPAAQAAVVGLGLEDGTPVELRTAGAISSQTAHVGERLLFEVVQDVFVQGIPVITRNSVVTGRVVAIRPKRRIARGDELSIAIDCVRLADGEPVRLRGVKKATGRTHVAAMTGAMAATGVFFFPAAPFFLLLHGRNVTIPAGTEITAYVDGDTPLNRASVESHVGDPPITATSLLEISSTPAAAEIEIDDRLIGSAPCSVSLVPGPHHIVVKKAGYFSWDKEISISPGESMISVDLIAQ